MRILFICRRIAVVFFVFGLLINISPYCNADEKYEEISYEELVNRIGAKSKSLRPKDNSPLETVRIHTGVGYVTSFSKVVIDDEPYQRYQNGIQFALGVDLFSKNWIGETSFRNFGITNYGTEELQLREFDLKLGYTDEAKFPIDFRIMGGLNTRYMEIKDSFRNLNIVESTPGFLLSGGLSIRLNPVMSLGFEVSGKKSLIQNTVDRQAVDFCFDLRASL